ncbi:MAG: chromate transporter [Lachnospiraceae bacterium]|nr:chromate transporter [Lachnospiraceae bacterium]
MIFELFITFFKIGLFTIGGGYAMISVVQDECVERKKWLDNEEFLNLLAIAESTPGPIAINMATYTGYIKGKLLGAILATVGVILPSIIVISIISYFIKDFLHIEIISNAFFGIRIAVSIIIIKTAYNLIKTEVKNSQHKALTIALFVVFLIVMVATDLLGLNISTMILVFIAILLGIILSVLRSMKVI